jgi:hypothetical protein
LISEIVPVLVDLLSQVFVHSGNKRVESVWVPVFVQTEVLPDVVSEELNEGILSEIGFEVDDGEFIIEVEFELGDTLLDLGINPGI